MPLWKLLLSPQEFVTFQHLPRPQEGIPIFLEVQEKAVSHCSHFWRHFFLYKRSGLGFSRNGYFCLPTRFHPGNFSCIGVWKSFSDVGTKVAENNILICYFQFRNVCFPWWAADHSPKQRAGAKNPLRARPQLWEKEREPEFRSSCCQTWVEALIPAATDTQKATGISVVPW